LGFQFGKLVNGLTLTIKTKGHVTNLGLKIEQTLWNSLSNIKWTWELECDKSLQARFSVNSHKRISKAKVSWVRWYSSGTKIKNDYKFSVKSGIIITSYIKVFSYIRKSILQSGG